MRPIFFCLLDEALNVCSCEPRMFTEYTLSWFLTVLAQVKRNSLVQWLQALDLLQKGLQINTKDYSQKHVRLLLRTGKALPPNTLI